MSDKCIFCERKDNDFKTINSHTVYYSGIEIAINRQGMLRVRHYNRIGDEKDNFTTQDIVNIRHCPICGREFKGEG